MSSNFVFIFQDDFSYPRLLHLPRNFGVNFSIAAKNPDGILLNLLINWGIIDILE